MSLPVVLNCQQLLGRSDFSVSVVISTYMRPNRLVICVRSVVCQTLPPKEVIIVHDGPGEATRRALEEAFQPLLDSGLICFIETPVWHGRPAPARNLGVSIATGGFVAFCDDDDFWFRTKLESQMRVVEDDPSVGAVFSLYTFISSNGNSDSSFDQDCSYGFDGVDRLPKFKSVSLRGLLFSSGLCHSSALVRRHFLTDEFFPETSAVKAFEDYCAWIKLLINDCDLRVVQAPLVGYLFDNATSIRGNKIAHNIRMCIYVTKQLISAGRIWDLPTLYIGRVWAAIRILTGKLL